jgi:DNA polymerase III subunit delta
MARKPAPTPAGLSADARVVILHGKEAMLRQLHTQALREALSKVHGSVDTLTFDGQTAQAADVLDECRSFGLIAGYKLVLVDHADQLVKEATRPLFERYCEALAEGGEAGATLVLRADTWRPGNLDKKVAAVGAVIKCEEPSRDEAIAWAVRRAAKEHKAALQPDAAEMLVDRVGANLARLDSELGKLSAAAGENAIDPRLVAYFVGASREEQVWGIQESILSAPPEEALRHLRYILDVSRQPAVMVSWALTDLARKIHAASRAMAQGAKPGELFKPLKLWGGSGEAVLGAARRIPPGRALELLRAAVRADMRQKSGFGEPERTLEMLVLEFAWRRGA